MTTVNLEQTFDDVDNKVNAKELHLKSVERLMPPPSYDTIDFISPPPPPSSTVTTANLVSDPAYLTTNCPTNLYNILYNNPKAGHIHSYLSSQKTDEDLSGYFLGLGAKSPSSTVSLPNSSTASVTTSWPLLTTTACQNNQSICYTSNGDSFSNMAVATTEDSTLDVGLTNYKKDSAKVKTALRNEKDNTAEAQSSKTDETSLTKDEALANEAEFTITNSPCDLNLLGPQDGLKCPANRTKGRSLLHRLASFAAAASNSTNLTGSSTPNRQLEKLAKRSFRLNSSGFKQSSLLMEILKLNAVTEEEQQQHIYDDPLNCKEKSKAAGLSTAYHMLASQLLYSQLQQQKSSPLLILDYTSNNNSKYGSNNNNTNNNQKPTARADQEQKDDDDGDGDDDGDDNNEIVVTTTPNESNSIDIKTEDVALNETYLKLQPASPAVSSVTNSSFNYDDSVKIFDLWHEKLKVLTQAHSCLEQFLEINQDMRNAFESSLQQRQNSKQILNNLRDEKDFVESILSKLHFVFRHCEDSRQLYLRMNNEQASDDTGSFSPAHNLKYLIEDRFTPELKPVADSKKSDLNDQEKSAIKKETGETNGNIESETKASVLKNVWQPFANDSQQEIRKVEEPTEDDGSGNQKHIIQRDELFSEQNKIKSPVCFWHPKNLGVNRNDKAVTAVEIILECAALKSRNQKTAATATATALNIPISCSNKTNEKMNSSNSSPQPTTPQQPPTLTSCNSPFLQAASASSSSSSTSLSSNHQDEAPTLNMLMADCGTSSFLTALSNRALINLASSTSTINANIPPITTTSPSCNRRKMKKQETNSPPTSHANLNTTSSFATSPPITNNQMYGTHASTAAAAVAALQEKALSDMFKVRFSALTAAAVINAATASANAAATVDTNTGNNTLPITNSTLNTEGPYDLSIGSKFKKM